MHDYIEINKNVYNNLADEYYEKLAKYNADNMTVGKSICEFIFNKTSSIQQFKNQDINVLELGCGPGAILSALKNRSNISSLYAIDFATNMIQFAQKSNDMAQIYNANILDVQDIDNLFNTQLNGKIDIIIMAAFIHLFPKNDARNILHNTKSWLSPNGIIYLDTTNELVFKDGSLCPKNSKKGEMIYFRTKWTKKAFNIFLNECGYDIIEQKDHTSNEKKIWMRTIIKPKE